MIKNVLLWSACLAAAPSFAAQKLECKSTSDTMAKFSIIMDKPAPLSPFPTLVYRTAIQGFQEGEPGAFYPLFKDAEATMTRHFGYPKPLSRMVVIQSAFEKDDYRASFDARVDLKSLKGKFQAVDNSEGDETQADARSDGAIAVSCTLAQVKAKKEHQKAVVFKCLSEKTAARVNAYVSYGEIHASTDGGLTWRVQDGMNVKYDVLGHEDAPPFTRWRFFDEEKKLVATVVQRFERKDQKLDVVYRMTHRGDSSIKCTKTEEATAPPALP